MTNRKKIGRRSKNKGKDYERYLAHTLNEWAGLENEKDGSFKRRWSGRAETPQGGDLINPSWFPIIVEARKRESWSFDEIMRNGMNSIIAKWWEEMVTKNKTHWVMLAFSKNRQPDYIAFDDSIETPLLKLIGECENNGSPTLEVELESSSLWIVQLDEMIKKMSPEWFGKR